eukprot:m51a1_g2136 hypothetical protein (1117) ;mRNA; f:1715146-1719480
MAAAVTEYTFDDFDDGAAKERATHEQTQSLRQFVDDYVGQLEGVEEELLGGLAASRAIAGDPSEPIAFDLEPREKAGVLDLVQTANKPFNKLVAVLSYLCVEIRHLRNTAEEKFYGPLAVIGEQIKPEEQTEGECQVTMGRMLPFLTDASNLISRICVVVLNAVRQLASLYHSAQQLYANLRSVHMTPVYEAIAEAFGVLITFDELLGNNAPLCSAWSRYNMMMKPVMKDPAMFGQTEDSMRQFDMLLKSLQGALFEKMILRNCIEQNFDIDGVIEVTANKTFKKEFAESLRLLLASIGDIIGEPDETNQRNAFPGFLGLYTLYLQLFGDYNDKRFFKDIYEVSKRIPVVTLFANRAFYPAEFLTNFSSLARSAGVDPTRNFQTWVAQYNNHASKWMAQLDSNATNRAALRDSVAMKIALVRQGVHMAHQIAFAFKTAVALHIDLQQSISKADLRALCQCVVVLKAIHAMFRRRMPSIAESVSLMAQQVGFDLVKVFAPIRKDLEGNAKLSAANLDVLAAVTTALSMLRGCATLERRTVLRVSFAVFATRKFFNEEEMEFVGRQMRKLDMILDLRRYLAACDCSFMYWSREMVPEYFRYVWANPSLANTLQYLLCSLEDVIPLMRKAIHMDPAQMLARYKAEVDAHVRTQVLEKLEQAVDADLRLQTHSHLQVADRNPFKDGIPDIARFLDLRPLVFAGESTDIKQVVGHYLDCTFYNTNTVSLHDWRTYESMRNLARTKYGLTMTEVHLPAQTIEQGLDVLEIMRNIDVFVSKYHYNLNNQVFVERQSESKTLNTIAIGSIANSIRTHGTGIMNTTVNFSYQYLRTLFSKFSQFLFDEHIKGRLLKDIKHWKEHREEYDIMYPFERADKFNKEIRKLGIVDGNQTFLDQFRILITHIGNVMGYIRMIRSGGLLYCADAIQFVPDLRNIVNFAELVSKEKLSPESVEAAKNLDLTVSNLSQSFEGGFEYFALLVQVFAGEFRNPENHHLRNFYVIVPPLIINFIEHILSMKERIVKKASQLHADGYVFSDDGFAIGIAYILKLLDQNADFDSLHFFDSVRRYYDKQAASLSLRPGGKRSKDEQQTTMLNLRKVQAYLSEYDLLRFSFDGAKIFFDN